MNEVLSRGMRLDGRGLCDMRELTIETNIIEKAEGSARVKLGNTELIAGVKVNLGTPFPDTPDKGLLIVSAEVLPLLRPTLNRDRPMRVQLNSQEFRTEAFANLE